MKLAKFSCGFKAIMWQVLLLTHEQVTMLDTSKRIINEVISSSITCYNKDIRLLI